MPPCSIFQLFSSIFNVKKKKTQVSALLEALFASLLKDENKSLRKKKEKAAAAASRSKSEKRIEDRDDIVKVEDEEEEEEIIKVKSNNFYNPDNCVVEHSYYFG